MKINEIVLQGVSDFQEMTRVQSGDGVTVVTHQEGRVLGLIDVVRDLFFPENSARAKALMNEGPARIGVVAEATGDSFRLLRDLRADRISLINADLNETIAKRADDVSAQVQALSLAPTVSLFDSIFGFQEAHLPSKDLSEEAGDFGQEDENDDLGPVHEFDFSLLSAEQKNAKVGELQNMRKQVLAKKEREFEIDGWRREGFELDETLRELTSAQLTLDNIEREMGGFEDVRDVPPGLFEEVRSLQQQRDLAQERQVRKTDLVVELEKDVEREVATAKTPLQLLRAAFVSDRKVSLGVIVGVAAIIVAIVSAFVFPPLRWVALLDIPAFGVALVGSFLFLDRAEYTTGTLVKLEHAQSELDDFQERVLDVETRLQTLLAPHELTESRVHEMQPSLERFHEVKSRYDQALGEIEALQSDPVLLFSIQRRDQLGEDIKEAEELLYAGADAFLPDIGTIDAEISALADDLAGKVRKKRGSRTPAIFQMFEVAASSVQIPLEELIARTRKRITQYVGALSDSRYGGLSFDGQIAMVLESTSKSHIAFSGLPPGDKDVVYISARLTLVEYLSAQTPFPLFLDGVFAAFPQTKTALLVNLLQFLGTKMQVLCISSNVGLQTAARTRVTL